ncbi:DoxX family protein [Sinomicrobium weinanense]|uniref:DoxX family protein n=1 Tax=Sinomicrobium weinanense TaxID=2842200 RepID=A0A926Q4K3_9FLAO|nr:DoxX family protein [Sinomicrobium weinanense]MBC9798069.1 DoxX family protein [Sinomicrobium weinanense]MBU3122518.1 DoxX family protein [Sinomicrobium weinanense]
MKFTEEKIIEWFLRIAISAGFLSAVADRFGLWDEAHTVWGNWDNFIAYTQTLNPWFPTPMISFTGGLATALEIVFGIALLTPFKTSLIAKGAGGLLLLFALSMTFSDSIKAPLDYSVFCASAAAFALSLLTKKR